MRLWSLHPQYLDRQGLTACWRESLLAQAVLAGRTRGYLRHSQLTRFRDQPDPLATVGAYLVGVAVEARARNYRFDTTKIERPADVAGAPAAEELPGLSQAAGTVPAVPVTSGQVEHEWAHLMARLEVRTPARAAAQLSVVLPDVHPLFVVVPGPTEPWERSAGRT